MSEVATVIGDELTLQMSEPVNAIVEVEGEGRGKGVCGGKTRFWAETGEVQVFIRERVGAGDCLRLLTSVRYVTSRRSASDLSHAASMPALSRRPPGFPSSTDTAVRRRESTARQRPMR